MGLEWCVKINPERKARVGDLHQKVEQVVRVEGVPVDAKSNLACSDAMTGAETSTLSPSESAQAKQGEFLPVDSNRGTEQDAPANQGDEDEDEDGKDRQEVSVYLGPYSTMHTMRRDWVKAAVAWLDQKHTQRRLLRESLQKWIDVPPALTPVAAHMLRQSNNALAQFLMDMHGAGLVKINAGVVPRDESDGVVQECAAMGLLGLWYLVQHSDCEGHYTPTECAAILETQQVIRPYFGEDDMNGDYLLPVLKASVEHGQPLRFC